MNKLLTKITTVTINIGVIFTSFISRINAQQSPYEPHIPVDSSFTEGSLGQALIIGGILYILGLGILAYSEKLKTLIDKRFK